ncbi:MAG: C1 family peptidase [Euryarchaeota archaeon]|nr:C1 family peptidase [Euryarchaeota archaeon]
MHLKTIAVAILLTSVIWSASAANNEAESIRNINHAINECGYNWTAGATSVSGWTDAEQRQLMLTEPIPAPRGKIVSQPSMRTLQYEERFNWCDSGMVTSVKSQGMCGSCWAFGAIAAVESKFLIDTGMNLDLSEQHLVSDCCSAGSCDGGWPDHALDYMRDTGVSDEACYPYAAKDSGCNPCTGWVKHQITGYDYVESTTGDFKWALKEYGPLSVVVHAPNDWYYYREGVYSPVTDVGWANHAVLLVGWDDSDGCWIIKNSWGTGWGEQGYARVKYGDLEKYDYAHAVTGIVEQGGSEPTTGWISPIIAVATSEYSDTYLAEKSIDGDPHTHWFSERNEESPYIVFDLGKHLTINNTRVIIHDRYVPLFVDVSVASDGTSWRTVAEATIDETGYVEVPFAPVECRYVRLLQSTAPLYGTCTEFEVCIHEKEDHTSSMMSIVYADRTETIEVDPGVLSIALSTNGTKIFEWWNQ